MWHTITVVHEKAVQSLWCAILSLLSLDFIVDYVSFTKPVFFSHVFVEHWK